MNTILESKVPTVNEQEKKIFVHDARLLIILRVLAFIFQIVSGWTEWIGLKAALSNYIGDSWGKVVAFIIAFSIEYGIMFLLTYIVNGIYYAYLSDENFTTKQRKTNKVKFAQILILLIAMVSVSMFLSKNNAKLAIRANPIKPKVEDVSHFQKEQDERTGKIEGLYKSDKADLSEWQKESKAAIQKRYETKVNSIQQDIKVVERKEERTNLSYTTKKTTLRKKIAEYRAKEAEELGKISQEHDERLNKLLSARNRDIINIKEEISSRKAPVLKRNDSIMANNEDYSIIVSNFLALYAQFAVLGFVIVRTWICLSLNTCGIKPKIFISKEYFESSILKELWTLIVATISRPIRNAIRKRLSRVKPIIALDDSEAVYRVSDAFPMLTVASKKDDLEDANKPRKIGFEYGKNKTDENTPYENRITGQKEVEKIRVVEVKKGYTRKCEYCETDFIPNHKKHRFCCGDCRKKSWEKKTGRQLKLKPKK